MANFENDFSCGQAQEVIEAYVDDEAGDATGALESHVAECPQCAEELALARTIQEALHGLPAQRCPDAVMAGALEEIERRESTDARNPGYWRRNGKRLLFGLPVAAAAVLAIGLFSIMNTPQEPSGEPTPAEIKEAELQVRWTLAYIGNLNQRNAERVATQLVKPRIVSPVIRGLERAMDAGSRSTTDAQL